MAMQKQVPTLLLENQYPLVKISITFIMHFLAFHDFVFWALYFGFYDDSNHGQRYRGKAIVMRMRG